LAKHLVVFQPSGRRAEVEEGTTLMDAARNMGVDIETICGTKHTCGQCKVQIQEGEFAREGIISSMEHVSALNPDEVKFLRRVKEPNMRLACVAEVRGDVVVFVPERSRAGRQVVRKAARELVVEVAPAVLKYYVELIPPTLRDTLGDQERLLDALHAVYGLEGLYLDYRVLRELSDILRASEWKVTVSVWRGREVQRVESGFVDDLYGVAVDVGTTTVAGYLTDLKTGKVVATESMMNPQVRYGEDVMSRITYAQEHEGGRELLTTAIREGLDQIFTNLAARKRLKPTDISEVVLVGNTAMHHLFVGLDPVYLGKAPFPPVLHHSLDVRARDMGLSSLHPATNVHVLPNEAGFVGADNVGVLLAEEPYNQDEIWLIIDIGTNGEIILGNREKLISSSCATGPAFEGAHIKFGMRAAPGAIERVRIAVGGRDVSYRLIAPPSRREEVRAKGICGSGIIDAVAEMYRAGVLLPSGRFAKDLDTPRLRRGEDGPEFVLAWADETDVGADITITQADVRALQLAKSAMYAGIKLMMRRLGVEQVDRVILAGAFGSYIDKVQAMTIGLFPDCDLEKVYAVGNAAGDGARIALVNAAKRDEADRVAREVEYIELTVEPDFERVFMEAMYFPHMKDKFPHLEEVLGRAVGA
jgi:uncharacterized 2Fe-2S/4Fe-4S cluster protein (DUF4445 family)